TQVRAISEVASAVTKGDLTRTIGVEAKGEVEALKDTINQMIANLKATTLRNQEQDWLKSNLAKFTQMLQGQKELNSVTKRILSELAQVVNAQHGLFYIMEPKENILDSKLKLIAAYAFRKRKDVSNEFAMGEGLVGQGALEKERILLTNVPGDYIQIGSGLGEATPVNILVLPVLFEGKLKAVIELASFDSFSQTHQDFLEGLTESIGIVLNTIETSSRTEDLLAQSQSLAGELKSQQEVLRKTNEELEEKALLLASQKEEVEQKNNEVEVARKSLEEKAQQLTITSKYKSEFLANMSHELRTPLNSLQILAHELIENKEGNLTDQQIQFAKTINTCGDDLIQLINDILDISKIESGYITVETLPVSFIDITRFVETTFRHVSEAKHLNFNIEIDENIPEYIETDPHRLNQILKNLLSNAFKFTEKGNVQLKIYKAPRNWKTKNSELDIAKTVVAFEITDSGIGISRDKQNIIFEAFQQAEGSTSRKYGGTGLGLSISRGLSDLLGGVIELESELGEGSRFTLFLPISISPQVIENRQLLERANGNGKQKQIAVSEMDGAFMVDEIGDDRSKLSPGDKILLMVEDDLRFAKIMLTKAHDYGVKLILATKCNEVLDYISQYTPTAISLDINMPDMNGWKVLDRLKNDLSFRHIPVYIISGEEDRNVGLRRGARNCLQKPLKDNALKNLFEDIIYLSNKKVKDMLIIEDDEKDSSDIAKIIKGDDINIVTAKTSKEAFALMNKRKFDCLVVDPSLSDSSGFDILKTLDDRKDDTLTSVVVRYSKNLTKKEETQVKRFAKAVVSKEKHSLEQLADQTALFLHRQYSAMPELTRQAIDYYRKSEDSLKGKKVLIVDDDVRNLFALTTALERFKINVLNAESGQEAIANIEKNPDIDVVLMDIMMPEMDGYETMKQIRKDKKNDDIAIIAVTAKAMKGDRQKCIESGASDYITKPVNVEQLLTLMRVWVK
ncbi:MAG TPA: response regulator, partial [Bacteroidia bacterium]|nr:response regulator [Bacteroidia bacterium]